MVEDYKFIDFYKKKNQISFAKSEAWKIQSKPLKKKKVMVRKKH